jgi:3-dehydroquinate dehydratase-1
MNTLTVRGVKIGQGRPKICVPIMGENINALVDAAIKCVKLKPDIYEWRADHFSGIHNVEAVMEAIKIIRRIIEDKPLIFTVRSVEEGGEASIDIETYAELIKNVSAGDLADIADVELGKGGYALKDLISCVHDNKKLALISYHDFEKTPEEGEFLSLVSDMKSYGADIFKLAVMAKSTEDAVRIFQMMSYMKNNCKDRPFAVIGMGEMGVLSRIGGGLMGNGLTFAKGGEASAPGQLEAEDVRIILNILHKDRDKNI